MTIPAPNIWVQATPNPDTFKFVIDRPLIKEGSAVFISKEQSAGSPLPVGLFDIEGVKQIFVGNDYVSVTKIHEADWSVLTPKVLEFLKEILVRERHLVNTESINTTSNPHEVFDEKDAEIVSKIKDILNTEIRPAVAMDGGDIQFHGYADGIVTLYLRGACSGCPSSSFTLQMGVENRLKALIPEIQEVVQI